MARSRNKRQRPTKRPSPSAQQEKDERPAKRFKSDFQKVITVLAGEDEVPFTIHESAICARSPFFEAACKQEWREGQEGIVPLKSVDEVTFNLYAKWIYSGKIDLNVVEVNCDHGPGPECKEKCFERRITDLLVKLYVAGDILLDPCVKNKVVDKLLDHFCDTTGFFYLETIDFVWENTTEDSPLRRLLMDHLMLYKSGEFFKYEHELYNNAFLLDLCKRQMEWKWKDRSGLMAVYRRKGQYHVPDGTIKEEPVD